MLTNKEILRVAKLNKSFGDLHVLKDIDLAVDESDVVVLIGASGSGKSTLLRCLNFLEFKDNGAIYLEDEKIEKETHNLNQVRQRIGMVFQHFNLFPHKTVLENIIEAPIHVKKYLRNKQLKKGKPYWTKSDLVTNMMYIHRHCLEVKNNV